MPLLVLSALGYILAIGTTAAAAAGVASLTHDESLARGNRVAGEVNETNADVVRQFPGAPTPATYLAWTNWVNAWLLWWGEVQASDLALAFAASSGTTDEIDRWSRELATWRATLVGEGVHFVRELELPPSAAGDNSLIHIDTGTGFAFGVGLALVAVGMHYLRGGSVGKGAS